MLTTNGLELFQKNPELFFEHVLGVTYESYQKEILDNIVAYDRVAVAACHSVGKSWTLARVVLWYLYCFPYSKVITTAPTSRQVEKILWSEIRAAHMRAKVPLGGRVLTTEIKVKEEGDWGAIGFSPSNEVSQGEGQGTQSSFQGWHSENLMVIFDEATGVRPAVWTMAEGLLTTSGVKFIAIANPTSTQSEFYKCFTNRTWAKQKINCFHSPNLIENGITDSDRLFTEIEHCRTLDDAAFLERMKSYRVVKGYLLTTRWVIEKALDWGLDSALFLSKVLGEFPEEGDNVAIPLRVVEEAQRREYVFTGDASERKTLGVDVARFGTDSSIITRMHGGLVKEKRVKNKRRETELVGEIAAMCAEEMPDIIVVDETGLGAGVVDMLVELRNEGIKILTSVEIRGVQFGASAADGPPDDPGVIREKEKYVNLKARMYDLLAKDMRANIALVDEEVYLSELPSIQYSYDSKGRMKIESKDDYKKRTGRGSPDHADSLALANYGRYDELSVGEFTEQYSKPQKNKPRSWGKKEKAKW